MPTPVSAARQCLASDSASALDAAVAAAHRRSHAQTTSLHVVFGLLSSTSSSPSPSLLRDALTRARTSAYSPRLQFKALDLCFSVALDRLPSTSVSEGDEPPVSNSLMAAIKRSQANQRRHPDTFHLYQQQQSAAGNTSQAFAGVRVELQQLVLAILDDPIVSRVFGEAGFRSCDIKLAILRPPPPILRFPRAARCPPLFLCNFSASEGFGFHLPAHLAADAGDENCRRIAEVIVRKNGAARNPMLVGVGAAEAAGDFVRTVERQNWAGLPLEIRGVRLVSVERELSSGDKEVICARMEELGKETDEPGVVVSVGDLNGLVEGTEDATNCLVSELTKVLELRRASLWVMVWSATYETYLKFLSRYPMVDKVWNLELLPITSHRTGMGGLQPKPPSLMDSFVPFGGLFPQAFESIGTLNNPSQSMPRCQICNEQYEKEATVFLKGNDTSLEDPEKTVLPSWLQKADAVGIKEGFDLPKVKDDKFVSNAKIIDLQKKWNKYCQHVHRRSHIVEAKNYQVIPHFVGIPYISDTANFSKSVTNPIIPKSQNNFGNAFTMSVGGVPKTTTINSQSISVPFVVEPSHIDLTPNLHDKISKVEPILAGGFQSHQTAPSDLGIQDGHTSPSSVTCVTTELALGAANNYFSLEGKLAPEGSSQCSTPRKINEPSQCLSRVHFHASSPPSFHNTPAKGSYIHAHSLSSGNNWSGVSHTEQRVQSSPNIFQKFDASNYKAFYTSLVAKVGRQEEALWAISEAIIQCKTRNEKHHGPSMRGAIWLSFLGPDRAGKKMAALALAELIFGCKEDLICIDLAYDDDNFCQGSVIDQKGLNNCNTSFRGKTIIDHIAMEISKKPLSVFLLENVDKTDLLAQNSLSNAIRTGKFSDSHGREVGINNSFFITTAKDLPGKAHSPIKEKISFSEERILSSERWKMKILVEPLSEHESFRCSPNSKVSVISRQESKNNPVPPCRVFISKRKLDFSGEHKCQDEYSTSIKRPHRSSGIDLDLNLSAEELDQNGDCNSSSENTSISDNSHGWLEEFFNLMDKTVCFKPFDFDSLVDYVLKEISRGFCSNFGSNYMLEIDEKVMEQILAATLFMRNKSDLGVWIEEVLCKSLSELRQRHKLPDCSVVRLVANQDLLIEESELGMFLPSKIILE
ncbi:hypothetical protein IEQ34_010442 [Dendrobium chrysotoxum]|uniref:Clp R domain-containing protein n=1 Tax=Dendrobium chrysotoxum TaxID=161865 RepID=A0AAV7H1V6_DENCH|nr:hypothetical protein IEQ34_010442 [Dendrobium chrysotoxum]